MKKVFNKFKTSRKSIISFTDSKHPGIKYIAHNIKKYELRDFKIDGDLILDNSINKCDFGFYVTGCEKLFLIELKGNDINHAFKQFVGTCDWFNTHCNGFNELCNKNHLFIRVVCSSYNIKRSFHIEEYKKVLKSKYLVSDRNIKIKEKILEENII